MITIKNEHETSAATFGDLYVGDTFLDGDDLYIKVYSSSHNAMHLNKHDYGFTNFVDTMEVEKVDLEITVK